MYIQSCCPYLINPFPLPRSIQLKTVLRPQFGFPKSWNFLQCQVVGLSPNPQPAGAEHHIYKPQGRVAQLYPRHWVPILVAFYILHGLQWDYYIPWSPHRQQRISENNNALNVSKYFQNFFFSSVYCEFNFDLCCNFQTHFQRLYFLSVYYNFVLLSIIKHEEKYIYNIHLNTS